MPLPFVFSNLGPDGASSSGGGGGAREGVHELLVFGGHHAGSTSLRSLVSLSLSRDVYLSDTWRVSLRRDPSAPATAGTAAAASGTTNLVSMWVELMPGGSVPAGGGDAATEGSHVSAALPVPPARAYHAACDLDHAVCAELRARRAKSLPRPALCGAHS